MRTFLQFLTKLKGFWKFYKNYEYDGETVEFIIDTYVKVLCNRTRTMSKPTYYCADIVREIDNWYEDNPEYAKGIKALETVEVIDEFLESEIFQAEERMKEPCYMFDGVEVSEEQEMKLNKSHIRFCDGILEVIEKEGEIDNG